MRLKITSWRGHHQADVETPVARSLFDKMTGRSKEALPQAVKIAVPDTFAELTALWNAGNPGYTALKVDENKNATVLNDFDPEAEEVIFLAPITGG